MSEEQLNSIGESICEEISFKNGCRDCAFLKYCSIGNTGTTVFMKKKMEKSEKDA